MLTVNSDAGAPSLLTTAQLRAAADLDANDASQDASLKLLGNRVTAEIVTACNIAIGQGAEPTLATETLTETFRHPRHQHALVLSRRHNIVIASVDIDGTTLDPSEYEADPESGIMQRFTSIGYPCGWWGTLVTVVYDAGFDTWPADLTGAAYDLLRVRLSEQSRDPLAKSTDITVTDIEEVSTSYQLGGLSSGTGIPGALPPDIDARLTRYRNVTFA